MNITTNQMKNYKKIKRKFSKTFDVDQKTVQRVVDDIITEALTKTDNIITTEDVVTLATPTDNVLHDILDWGQDDAYRQAQVEAVLDLISIFVTTADKVYEFVKQ